MTAFWAAFITIFIAEMGDKTQMVTLTMSSRCGVKPVYGGAMAALGLITALAVGVGGLVAEVLPTNLVAIASGAFFIFMALLTYLQSEQLNDEDISSCSTFSKTFGMVFLAELGDKTQLATIALAANYGQPITVFLGAMAGQALNHGLAVFLGSRFLALVSPRFLKLLTVFIFLLFGLLMLYGGLL